MTTFDRSVSVWTTQKGYMYASVFDRKAKRVSKDDMAFLECASIKTYSLWSENGAQGKCMQVPRVVCLSIGLE